MLVVKVTAGSVLVLKILSIWIINLNNYKTLKMRVINSVRNLEMFFFRVKN